MTSHPILVPPTHPLIRPACLPIEFHLFCISQGFPAPALIPIITCKHFEISAENKTGLVSEICPRLNSDKTFTKITEFGKSATKIAKITKFTRPLTKSDEEMEIRPRKAPTNEKQSENYEKLQKFRTIMKFNICSS